MNMMLRRTEREVGSADRVVEGDLATQFVLGGAPVFTIDDDGPVGFELLREVRVRGIAARESAVKTG